MSSALLADIEALEAKLRQAGLSGGVALSSDGGCLLAARADDAVVVVEPSALREAERDALIAQIVEQGRGLVIVGPRAKRPARLPQHATAAFVEDTGDAMALASAIEATLERVALSGIVQRSGKDIARYQYELGELVAIARAISRERDLTSLLPLILEKSRYITAADAGSIYVLEGDAERIEDRTLRFKHSQNESVAFESAEFSMPVSMRSIAGAAVLSREAIVIDDAYALPEGAPYEFDPSFDKRVGYRTRSIVAVPMVSATDDVIGVIQLINRKRDPKLRLRDPADVPALVEPFDARSIDLLGTLASQAGIALENALLYEEIRTIFEGFVLASVQAIEARDPTTSGHSQRVALLACGLAEKVDRADSGKYAADRFSTRDMRELEYASLLHDFGKIGVREKVLVKANKLYPEQLASVQQRIAYASLRAELDLARAQLEGRLDATAAARELQARLAHLKDVKAVIETANRPAVLSEDHVAQLEQLSALRFVGPGGAEQPLLSEAELDALRITRGSLTASEIDEIRSHVVHTRAFLSRIPWGRTLKNLPEIAGAHHEKLNGAGYPSGMHGPAIPLASKIMSIADIYDALTARDRPYKKALPHERAMQILRLEVNDNHVCGELVQIFADAHVHHVLDPLRGGDGSLPPCDPGHSH